MDKTRVYLTESLSTKDKKSSVSVSILSKVLSVMGYLTIISGFAIGAYMAFASKGIDILTFLVVCLGSLIIGLLIIAVGKIIYYLQEISNSLKK